MSKNGKPSLSVNYEWHLKQEQNKPKLKSERLAEEKLSCQKHEDDWCDYPLEECEICGASMAIDMIEDHYELSHP